MTMDLFLFALKFFDRLRLAEIQPVRWTFDVLLTRLRNRVLFWSTTGVQSSPSNACLICVPQSIKRPSSQQLTTIASWKATMIFEENRWNSSRENTSYPRHFRWMRQVMKDESWCCIRQGGFDRIDRPSMSSAEQRSVTGKDFQTARPIVLR